MKAIFDFLYYCLYKMFKSLDRKEEKDEVSASSFYSILLSTNVGLILFPLKFIIPKGFFDPPLLNFSLKILLASIFVGLYFFCRHYFLTNKYYLDIFERYDVISHNPKRSVIIGIGYSLTTFISFISIVSLLSDIKWHL
jgi:hypothetical protein